MKSFALILALVVANRLLLWCFPHSDALVNYSLLPVGILAAVLIVTSEIKNAKVSLD